MPTRPMRLLLLFPLLSFACTPAPDPNANDCVPACATGYACMGGVCAPVPSVDAGAPDLATPMGTCTPPCAAPTPYCATGNHCVACLADAHCPTGNVCTNFVCVPGCKDDSRCGGAEKCCNGACVDPSTDEANCGGCGVRCAIAHAESSCTQGQCALAACAAGWGDCNSDPKDGCESNFHVDPDNCGGCGMMCKIPNAIAACSDGCYAAACQFGYDDCNNDPKDGCETSVLSDPKNCGACGQACGAVPHGQASCTQATCGIRSCDAGFSDCDGNGANGCETPTGTDVNNCGACGHVCPQGLVCTNGGCTCPQCNIPNAKTACVNNQCTLDSCVAGWGNCDGNAANGCEVNLDSDRNNCGACNMPCPQGNVCVGGQCSAKFAFQNSQVIDGMTVRCQSVNNTGQYTECDELTMNGLYFPNGISCGPVWSSQNSNYSDTAGFCQSLTGNAMIQVYYNCTNSITRATWKNHVWGTTTDNGYTEHVRCYY